MIYACYITEQRLFIHCLDTPGLLDPNCSMCCNVLHAIHASASEPQPNPCYFSLHITSI
jgi:hypothetical protein